jgi:hypothetical protein
MDTQVINITPRSNRERRDHYESNKLVKRLRRQAGQAIADFDMIREGDKVMARTAMRCSTSCCICAAMHRLLSILSRSILTRSSRDFRNMCCRIT